MTADFIRHLAEVAVAVFVINIPFGWWRDNSRKFSLQWILAVHVPVPIVIGLRLASHLGWHLSTFPVLIGSFFFGQFLGGRLHRWKVRSRIKPG